MANRTNQTKYVFIEIIGIFFLASAGIFVRNSSLSPINIGLWRIILALPFLFILSKNNLNKLTKKDILFSLLSGFFLAGDLIFFNIALITTSIANTNLLTNLTGFLIVPISYFVFKEKIPKFYILGLVIALLGVVTLVLGKASPSTTNLKGDLFACIACIFYALYILTTYKLRDRLNSSVILFIGGFGTIFALSIVAAIKEGIQIPQNINEFLNLLLLAICIQVIGQNVIAHCNGKISVNLSLAITLLQPVVASLYSRFLFNEKLTIIEMLGMVIVLIGVYICKKQFTNK